MGSIHNNKFTLNRGWMGTCDINTVTDMLDT